MALRYALSALALVGTALAQCSGDITISSSSDAQTISGCGTYNGTITIDPGVTGNLALDGIGTITGDLVCAGALNLNSFSADQLQTITGTFNLTGLIVMSTLAFSSISRVNRVYWVNLPALQTLNFGRGISEANQIYISNTQLTNLAGIELTQVGSMDVNNNNFLNTVNVNELTNVTTALSFSANGQSLAISFPSLQAAANLTFRNVQSVEMPALSSVAGSMGFYDDFFANFSAPNLTTIGSALAFTSNTEMTVTDFPSLTTIGGGFLLNNNTNLAAITGFPQLQRIGGGIDFSGDFSSVSFPKLSYVAGHANVTTSSNNGTICDLFNNAAKQQAIRGGSTCHTSTSSSNNGSGSGSGSGNGNGSGNTNAGTAITMQMPTVLAAVIGLAAAAVLL